MTADAAAVGFDGRARSSESVGPGGLIAGYDDVAQSQERTGDTAAVNGRPIAIDEAVFDRDVIVRRQSATRTGRRVAGDPGVADKDPTVVVDVDPTT